MLRRVLAAAFPMLVVVWAAAACNGLYEETCNDRHDCTGSPMYGPTPPAPTCAPACDDYANPCPALSTCGADGRCVEAFASCADAGIAACDVYSGCLGGLCVRYCSSMTLPCEPGYVCTNGGCHLPAPTLPVCGQDAGAVDAGADAVDAGDGG